ncbi:DUF5677 domain-containing protein [Hoeflea poritis]|uniref:DUF5677 domain-containing protein n=1 Tax=Hoeflea poritis TaxID=2993659 RepID=A0ABT4VNK0_9HYPH|nr:DUF5677 domain-containing protein [Hoeflea poritis]MDA4846251.1 DUF5677 domain-containing protein [Hoeflea poritis]
MVDDFQTEFDRMVQEIPREFLKRMIECKLKEAGIEPSPERVARVADAILAGEEQFILDDEGPELNVALAFDDEDIADLEDSIEEFCNHQLPDIISTTAGEAAHDVFKGLKKQWPEQKAWQDGQIAQFAIRLGLRWGEAFESYRMLLTAARELGKTYHTKLQKSRAKRNIHKRSAINRLHARACCVSEEILVLLQEGFADGAMARWRTLHEIATVFTLIVEHDDELAERYLLHEVVEAKRALETYEKTHLTLGYKPSSKREAARTRKAYEELRKRFGKEYCAPYGWAAYHLGTDGKRFSDLEEAAKRAQMRLHFKMASYNVHASAKGITGQLGLLDNCPALLAGRSNAGLEEPGQNAAISLVQITVLLLGPTWKFDDIVMANVLIKLRDKTVDAFIKAGRRLKRDDKALRRGLPKIES